MTAHDGESAPAWGPFETRSFSAEQTRALGRRLGQALSQGLALCLIGDLGSGKTCFVQGLARGLEVPPVYDITSPTYTLIHEYPGRMPLFHVDLYRLEAPDIGDLGLDDIFADRAVVAVEWAERLPAHQWPPLRLDLEFSTLHDESRMIRATAYGLVRDNLIKELFALFGHDRGHDRPA